MVNRTRLKVVGLVLLCSAFLLLASYAVTLYWLPRLIESHLLPRLVADTGVGPMISRIRRIGINGADAGPVILGPAGRPGIRVDAIQVDYSPLGLFKKRIDHIVLSGVTLRAEIKDNQLHIDGLNPAPKDGGGDESSSSVASAAPLEWPVRFRSAEIRNGTLHLRQDGRAFTVPFNLGVTPEPDAPLAMEIRLETWLMDQAMVFFSHLDVNSRKTTLLFEVPSLALKRLSGLPEIPSQLAMAGQAVLSGRTTVQWAPFSLSGTMVQLASGDFRISAGQWGAGAIQRGGENAPRFQLRLDQINDRQWRAVADNLMITGAVPLAVERITADLSKEQDRMAVSMVLEANLPASAESTLPMAWDRRIPIAAEVSGHYGHDGKWAFKLAHIPAETAAGKTVELTGNGVRIKASLPVFEANGKGRRMDGEGAFSLSFPKIRLLTDAGEVTIPMVSVTGKGETSQEGDRLVPSASWSIMANNTKGSVRASVDTAPIDIRIPVLSATGNFKGAAADSTARFTGKINLSRASVSAPAWDAHFSAIQAALPLQWPFKKKGKSGKIHLGGIRWREMELGSLSVNMDQTVDGISFKGVHKNRILPDAALQFSGKADLFSTQGPSAELGVTLSRPLSSGDIEPGQWFPKLDGLAVNGAFSMESQIQWQPAGLTGVAKVAVDQGRIGFDEKKVKVDNIRLRLEMPELPALSSAPKQELSFDTLSFGDLSASDGRVAFRIESPETIFIENANLKWCGGQIRSQAMRISSAKDEYDFRLYCDRLNLAGILSQLGVATAKGNGAVNGFIPVKIAGGKVSFDDGFLYSTPGDGGTIRLTGAEAVTAGIPKGTVQFNYADLTRAALEDFEYKWAKLRLVDENDTLLMQLQFDGKPAKTLPFEYKKEFGGFVRVDGQSRGSDFQGLSLDLNFRVPLNELLQYKEVLKMME